MIITILGWTMVAIVAILALTALAVFAIAIAGLRLEPYDPGKWDRSQ